MDQYSELIYVNEHFIFLIKSVKEEGYVIIFGSVISE